MQPPEAVGNVGHSFMMPQTSLEIGVFHSYLTIIMEKRDRIGLFLLRLSVLLEYFDLVLKYSLVLYHQFSAAPVLKYR